MKKSILYLIFCFFTMQQENHLFGQDETSVLFIGNSFTFMNDMPFMFKDIAESKGKKVFVDTVVEGGKDLNFHSTQTITFETIKARKWDYVILQAHSNELAQPDTKVDKHTLPYAKIIIDSIRKNNPCTQVILYMTWGYKFGNPKWGPISTYDSMQYRVKNQYLRFADLLDTKISPVGEVWKNIRLNYSGINLYDTDNHHPSPAGSYISACTHFTTIFGESPQRNLAVVPIDDASRQIIEMNAAQIVLNNLNQWRNIPRNDKLEAGFDLILQNDTLNLVNRSKNALWTEWDFGDGHISSEENPTHCYKEKGNYIITQRIKNSCRNLELRREIELK